MLVVNESRSGQKHKNLVRPMKIISVVGARPNFMKLVPLISAIKRFNECRKREWQGARGENRSTAALNNSLTHSLINPINPSNPINHVLVHTGQHYDLEMSETFFREFGLPKPDINLEVGSASHAIQTANIMIRFEEVCFKEKPDWVLVVGDVNSTMACTLVAAKLGIKVSHVEAGLRSFDRTMPEEINRIVTDALSDLLFTPSEDADENLLREGILPARIKRVGNIMIDTLVAHLERARQCKSYDRFDLKEKNYVLVTLHRPSNVDERVSLSSIMECLTQLSKRLPVIFPLHPRTRKRLVEFGLDRELMESNGLILCDPLGYHDTISLVDKARFVLTDSGGLQEETTFLNVPCLTLRPNTERPITITQGTNRLTSLEVLERDFDHVLNGHRPPGRIPDLWDGKTAGRIVRILTQL
jgi:UDP-N-acetylglucosamine 2-epimerase (non-hydrolysing)